jgi:hypothetical protein
MAALVFVPEIKEQLLSLGFEPLANTPQEFAKVGSVRLCGLLRMGSECPEAGLVGRKPEKLAFNRFPGFILADKAKFAVVGNQHEAIVIEIFCRLLAL